MARILRRLRGEPGLNDDERHLFARSLAATPDERWQMHENFLRSHGLFKRSDRKNTVSNSRNERRDPARLPGNCT